MSGGWTHTKTKALKGLQFQAVCQRVLITRQIIATPLIRIELLLPYSSFEHAQCALNSHCRECEFNTNSMHIDARYHLNGPQPTSGSGFDPVRSGFAPAISQYTHYLYLNKSINAHVCARRFNVVKMAGWTNDQTRAFVSIWGHTNVQGQLNGVTRNRAICETIATFAGTVQTVMVMRHWHNGHVTKTTLHL